MDIRVLSRQCEAGTYSYLVYGKEVGESGTRHLQGYLELPKRHRLSQVKALLPTAHLEPRRGTAAQASDYCKKEGDFFEHGDVSKPEQGRRTDLGRVVELVRETNSLVQIAQEVPESIIKYHKGISVLINLLAPKHESTEHTQARYDFTHDWSKTQIFTGPTNCGKTTYAIQLLPRALFCTHMDDLAKYDAHNYDGIIFDEACFLHLPREAQIHLVDQDQDRSLHVRYLCARIPKRTKKIFTTNKRVYEILLDDPAIMRRVEIHEM